jgi:hypothetical protein
VRRTPPNQSEPWTLEEFSKLKRLMSEGYLVRGIAKELGRTQDAVISRLKAEKAKAMLGAP